MFMLSHKLIKKRTSFIASESAYHSVSELLGATHLLARLLHTIGTPPWTYMIKPETLLRVTESPAWSLSVKHTITQGSPIFRPISSFVTALAEEATIHVATSEANFLQDFDYVSQTVTMQETLLLGGVSLASSYTSMEYQ